MSYAENLALLQASLQANAPYLSQSPTDPHMKLIFCLLLEDALTQATVDNAAPNISWTTASGQALKNKAVDWDVPVSGGQKAGDQVVFSLQTPQPYDTLILAGSVVSAPGSGINAPTQYFLTQVDATINGLPGGGTPALSNYAVGPVAVLATTPGAAGNVYPGALTGCSMGQDSGVLVTNATSVVTLAGTISNPFGGDHSSTSPNQLGIDADSDAMIQGNIAVVAAPRGSSQAAVDAMLAVPGIFDAAVIDPKQGTGYCYIYFCAADGTASGISGATNTNSGSPDSTYYLASPTLSGTALAAFLAVAGAVSTVPRVGSYSGNSTQQPLKVSAITSFDVTYSAGTGAVASVIEPLMTAAMQAAIQGLRHDDAPTSTLLFNACQLATNNALTEFHLTSGGSLIASLGSPGATLIYRCPTLVVTYDRI
jgi:hypothetical protein